MPAKLSWAVGEWAGIALFAATLELGCDSMLYRRCWSGFLGDVSCGSPSFLCQVRQSTSTALGHSRYESWGITSTMWMLWIQLWPMKREPIELCIHQHCPKEILFVKYEFCFRAPHHCSSSAAFHFLHQLLDKSVDTPSTYTDLFFDCPSPLFSFMRCLVITWTKAWTFLCTNSIISVQSVISIWYPCDFVSMAYQKALREILQECLITTRMVGDL